MSIGEGSQTPPFTVTDTILDDRSLIVDAYDRLELGATLANFVTDRSLTEDDVTVKLSEFSVFLANIAGANSEISVDLVRFGVDHLTDDMNLVASKKLGYERPTSWPQMILQKMGIKNPKPKQYIHGLDDRYWNKQFLEQYHNQQLTRRESEESDQEYLGRYIFQAVNGFIFSHFSYIPGANRHRPVSVIPFVNLARSFGPPYES